MKSTASESKPFQRLTGEPFQIDSDADFFMYLIQGIRSGS